MKNVFILIVFFIKIVTFHFELFAHQNMWKDVIDNEDSLCSLTCVHPGSYISLKSLSQVDVSMLIQEAYKCAQETGNHIPQGLIHCIQAIQEGRERVRYEDLVEALEYILKNFFVIRS